MSLIPAFMNVFAGAELYESLAAERKALVDAARAKQVFRTDDTLCGVQEAQARRGILGVNLVESIYGWTVRYDSGLQNFSILAGARRGDVNGSYEDAERFAREWVAQDPARRYAWVRK